MTIISLAFNVDKTEVRRYLGYRAGRTEDWGRVERLLDETVAAVQQVATPRGRIRTFALQSCADGSLWLPEPNIRFHSRHLSTLWQSASRVSLMLATLGSAVDELISAFFAAEQYAKGAIADAIGSAAAEAAMEQLHDLLRKEAAEERLMLTRRFSPGYGDVSLALQSQVGQALAAEELGVSVTPQYLLVPRKTITAMVGWQQPATAVCQAELNKCATCGMTACSYRHRT